MTVQKLCEGIFTVVGLWDRGNSAYFAVHEFLYVLATNHSIFGAGPDNDPYARILTDFFTTSA